MTQGIDIVGVSKSFQRVRVLHQISAGIRAGRFTVLTGPSGSGKTTLLNLCATIDRPDSGVIVVGDTAVTALSRPQRATFRAGCGLVFQRSGLLGGLTARENIELPHILNRRAVSDVWVAHLARSLGIAEQLDRPASTLSGGQGQRVALIRALAHKPAILFADEPTASLDRAAKHEIHALLRTISADEGMTVLMASHDEISTDYADGSLMLVDGRLAAEPSPERQATA